VPQGTAFIGVVKWPFNKVKSARAKSACAMPQIAIKASRHPFARVAENHAFPIASASIAACMMESRSLQSSRGRARNSKRSAWCNEASGSFSIEPSVLGTRCFNVFYSNSKSN